ncbi:MAG: hypothetical protein Q9196_007492 [Gyalolechia fulgens]
MALHHLRETLSILSSMRRTEGWRACFSGLGPSLASVVPANTIKFFTYGNCKALCQKWDFDPDSVAVQAISASISGLSTILATNPIWVVKTRLQLDKSRMEKSTVRQYKNSLDCASQLLRNEGFKGFYRGLSASVLGVGETILHLVLYEQTKLLVAAMHSHPHPPIAHADRTARSVDVAAAAAVSKCFKPDFDKHRRNMEH